MLLKNINLLDAIHLVQKYNKISEKEIDKLNKIE